MVGWILWLKYFDPAICNLPFLLIYSAAIAIILREEADVGDNTSNQWIPGLFGYYHKSHDGCNIL
jgi:hypothetical protein